MSKQYAKNTEV